MEASCYHSDHNISSHHLRSEKASRPVYNTKSTLYLLLCMVQKVFPHYTA